MDVSGSNDEALAPDGDANSVEPVPLDPAGLRQPLRLRNKEVNSGRGVPAAAELTAKFEKHFPGGTVIQAELRRPADAFSMTVLTSSAPVRFGATSILRASRPRRRAHSGRRYHRARQGRPGG